MYKFLINKGQAVSFIVGAAISGIFALFIFMGIKDRDASQMSIESLIETDIFNFGIYASIVLIVATVIVIALFAVRGLFTDWKSSRKVILGVAVILGIFLILYAMSAPETSGKLKALADEFGITDNISKGITAGIQTTGALLALTAVIWVLSELRNALK